MECREIHKLLSPFIDNELGIHDTFTVAEHLDGCDFCQREMQTLRQLDERLKTAGQAPVEGIDELHTTILALFSPRAWTQRWRGAGAAIAAMLFLVIGQQLFSAPSDPEATAFSNALVTEMKQSTTRPFSLPWLDPQSLQAVLRKEGLADVPNLGPAGFHLEGARLSRPLQQVFVQLIYRRSSEEVSLFVSRRWTRSITGVREHEEFIIVPLGMRAVFLVSKEQVRNFADVRQLAEEEISALST